MYYVVEFVHHLDDDKFTEKYDLLDDAIAAAKEFVSVNPVLGENARSARVMEVVAIF